MKKTIVIYKRACDTHILRFEIDFCKAVLDYNTREFYTLSQTVS